MSQENEKISNGGPRIIPKDTRKNSEYQQKANAKEEDLELCKSAEDMPELRDDQDELLADEQLRLNLDEPPPEILEYARRELGETDEVKCQMLQEFRDMIYGNLYWCWSIREKRSESASKMKGNEMLRDGVRESVCASWETCNLAIL